MYKEKYLKYKIKYIALQNQLGGSPPDTKELSTQAIYEEAQARSKEAQARSKEAQARSKEAQAKQEIQFAKWKQQAAQVAFRTQEELVQKSVQVMKKAQVVANQVLTVTEEAIAQAIAQVASKEAQIAKVEQISTEATRVALIEELVIKAKEVVQEAQVVQVAQVAFINQVKIIKDKLPKITTKAAQKIVAAEEIQLKANKKLIKKSEELLKPEHIITEEDKFTFEALKQELAKANQEVNAAIEVQDVAQTIPLIEEKAIIAKEKTDLTLRVANEALQALQKALKTNVSKDVLEAAQKVVVTLELATEALTATQAAQEALKTLVAKVEQEVLDKEAVYLTLQLESGNFLVKDYLQSTDNKLESIHINNPTTQFYEKNKIRNTSMPNLKYEENSFIVLKKLPNELKEGTFPVGLLIIYNKIDEIYVIEISYNFNYYIKHINTFLETPFKTITTTTNKYNHLLDCFEKSIDFINSNTNITNKDSLKNSIRRSYERITSYMKSERTIPN